MTFKSRFCTNSPINKMFLSLSLLFSLAAAAPAAYAAEKLEPVLKDRGKHFQTEGEVIPVIDDGIHDPENDAVRVFQQPVEAMGDFPRDKGGYVDWVQTVNKGLIAPRADQFGMTEKQVLDKDIIFTDTGAMPNVLFSHKMHTQWLDCSNCHPDIFIDKQGANNISMTDVFTGKYCGLCHGKVAFPVTKNCQRCHSVKK